MAESEKRKETGGGEEIKLGSEGVGEFCEEGKGKFGDGEEVELGEGEDQQTGISCGGRGSIT